MPRLAIALQQSLAGLLQGTTDQPLLLAQTAFSPAAHTPWTMAGLMHGINSNSRGSVNG